MALIILEGLDRTGKSSVAEMFQSQGYELIHLSAPSKKYKEPGYTGPSYLDDMIDLVQSAASKDIVLDRSHYGELVWPVVYSRETMLTDDDIDVIREIEDAVGVRRILMYDKDVESHWQRCVDNKEPLNRAQFLRARVLYDRMANKYGFEKITLTEMAEYREFKDRQDVSEPNKTKTPEQDTHAKQESVSDTHTHASVPLQSSSISSRERGITREQAKLEKANAINDVLSKRIIKGKGLLYDDIETEVRAFLNNKLGTILGNEDSNGLSKDEIFVLKSLVKRLKEKETSQ